MAALPENNISVTLVKNTLGASANGVGQLRSHPDNNFWGFASVQRGWAVTNPVAPFRIGDYRGYDHLWRCWAFSDILEVTTEYQDQMNCKFTLKYFPLWSEDDTAEHLFDILFKRTNDFNLGGYVAIATNASLINSLEYPFFFSVSEPPDADTNGPLSDGDTVYIAVVRKSSPARRWDENMSDMIFSGQVGGFDYYSAPITIPIDAYTYDLWVYDLSAFISAGDIKLISGQIHFKIDTRADIGVDWQVRFSKTSDFSGTVQTISGTNTLNSNPTGGTAADRYVNFNGTPINDFSIGNTVYYQARIVQAYGGTVNYVTDWSSTKSLTVLSEPPL